MINRSPWDRLAESPQSMAKFLVSKCLCELLKTRTINRNNSPLLPTIPTKKEKRKLGLSKRMLVQTKHTYQSLANDHHTSTRCAKRGIGQGGRQ